MRAAILAGLLWLWSVPLLAHAGHSPGDYHSDQILAALLCGVLLAVLWRPHAAGLGRKKPSGQPDRHVS